MKIGITPAAMAFIASLPNASGNSPVLKKTHAAQGLLRNAAAAGGSATAAAAALSDVVASKKNKRMLAEAGVMPHDATIFSRHLEEFTPTQVGNNIVGENVNDEAGFASAISGDGSLLAVGARRSNGLSDGQPGYVKVYAYSGSTESFSNLVDTIIGVIPDGAAPNGHFGQSVSLSGDGSIMAVGTFSFGYVNIYQRNKATGTYDLLQTVDGENGGFGSTIAVPTATVGSSVALSDDGAVLVMGGETTNKVLGYAYDATLKKYISKFTVDGPSATTVYLGIKVAISADGSTFAASTAELLGASTDGLVSVYQITDTDPGYVKLDEFAQAGLKAGDYDLEQFGSAISLSKDGSVLAIGARRTVTSDSQRGGAFGIFDRTDGGYALRGNFIAGLCTSGSGIGGNALSLSGDGLMLAVGSPNCYTGGGRVDVYDLDYDVDTGGDIEKYTTITGDDIGEQVGYSVGLSSDGGTLLIGARNGETTEERGHVEVWDFTDKLELEAPWSATFKDMAANFTEAYDGSQITLKYDIGRVDLSNERDVETELYSNTDGLCNTAPDNDVITSLHLTLRTKSILYQELVLGHDIDTSKIANSNIWNSDTGEIELCQKVMLTTPGPDASQMTVVEDIRNVTVLFDLNAGFEVDDIDLDAATISANNQNTTLSDYLSPYKCDAQGAAAPGTSHAPNDQLFICLESSSDDVLIDEVNEMKITGKKPDGVTDSTLSVIGSGSIPTYLAITSITGVDTGKVQVSTFVATNMFNFETEGAQIDVSGSVMMKFKDGRKLAVDLPNRMLQAANEDEAAEFDVVINIQSENEDLDLEGGEAMMSSAMAASGGKVVAILGMVFASAFALW